MWISGAGIVIHRTNYLGNSVSITPNLNIISWKLSLSSAKVLQVQL